MKKVSGMTFVHNAIESGYPIVEAIKAVEPYVDDVLVIDMESTDATRDHLFRMNVRIAPGAWLPGEAGECLKQAHALHTLCRHDQIIHFEADEVWEDGLISYARSLIEDGVQDLEVCRLQVTQNWQRVRWYPTLVHRVFRKGTVIKEGESTDRGKATRLPCIGPDFGYLWDCASTHRDNYIPRMKKQAELWGHPEPIYRITPYHFTMQPQTLTEEQVHEYLKSPHWLWRNTPLDIPMILRRLVGKECYEALLD